MQMEQINFLIIKFTTERDQILYESHTIRLYLDLYVERFHCISKPYFKVTLSDECSPIKTSYETRSLCQPCTIHCVPLSI
jgi:hypothetical protein